jgi:hypothetical protein
MTGSGEIQQLLSHPQLWRAGDLGFAAETRGNAIATGYPMLDNLLAGGGWPRDGLVELLVDRMGIGELRLLAPALATLGHESRWLIWINPPHIPYAPALAALGIQIEKVLLVHPKCHEDALWSLEQALKSGTCSVAIGWLDERRLTVKDLRRLQLAARQGGTLTALFRPHIAARHASMAELRMLLQPTAITGQGEICNDLLEVEIIKRRGGWPVASFSLPLQPPLVPLTKAELQAHVEGWRVRAGGLQTARLPAAPAAVPRNRQPTSGPAVHTIAEHLNDVRHA